MHFDFAPRVRSVAIWHRKDSLLRPSMNDESNTHIGRMLRVEGREVREEALECRRGGLLETDGVGVDVLAVDAACLVKAEVGICKDLCRFELFDGAEGRFEIDEGLQVLHPFVLWAIVVGVDDESGLDASRLADSTSDLRLHLQSQTEDHKQRHS